MISPLPKTLFRHCSYLLRLASCLPHFPLSLLNSAPARAMTSQSSQSIFQLKLDPLTGNSEWVVIREDDADEEDAAFGNPNKNLLASTSYLDMLNDSPRNRAYRLAIDKTITRPCHVLDIGAGTGLLSMMAARAMSSGGSEFPNSNGIVTACESYLPMVKLMKKVVHLNGMGKNINLINKRSDELEVGVDIPSSAQVLVSEILDSELLGEGLIPTLQHAHDKLLVENPATVPYKATIYAQLVESTFLWKLHDLYNNEANTSDGIHLVPNGSDAILSVKMQQHPMHCDAISKEIKLLSEPFKTFEFDFWKWPDSHGETEVLIKAIDDGKVHAVISWWVLQLDHEGTIFYSTAPSWIDLATNMGNRTWCDHWKQFVWFIPGDGVTVGRGQQVLLHAHHAETSTSYSLTVKDTEARQSRFTANNFLLTLPPERIATYGDSKWRSLMLTSLRNAGRGETLCVVADDSIFLAVAAAQVSKTARIISLFPGLREEGARYLKAIADTNGLTANSVNVYLDKKCLTLQETNQKKIDLLIGEPYFYGSDGFLPWQNLRFWKTRTMLDAVLSDDVIVMPCKAILKACAMSLPDLWNSRCCLSKIEGFDHSVVNTTLGACGDLPPPHETPFLASFVWQCGEIKQLSEEFTLMEFDLSKTMTSSSGKVQVEFTETGICHGFVLWIDWVMDPMNDVVVSTGPVCREWKQGVKLVPKPVAVSRGGKCGSAVIEASFNPENGQLTMKHSFA